MINNFIIVFFLFSLSICLAEDKQNKVDDKKEKKIYSQMEFDKKLKAEILRRFKKIKNGELVQFSNELFDKEKKLEFEVMNIKKSEEVLKNSHLSLKNQIIQFHKEQEKFLSCRSKTSKKRDKRILHMVEVISSMRPINASKILSVQDAKIAIDILSRLDAIKVSKIFNLMDKEISARLQKQYMTMQE